MTHCPRCQITWYERDVCPFHDNASSRMIEAIQSPDDRAKASPMTHEETREWLRKHGFDLSKQLSWWDDPETNCRHFTQ